MNLAASHLSRRVGADAAGRPARLLLLRDPIANVLHVVEDETAYFSSAADPAYVQRGAGACAQNDVVGAQDELR